MPITSFLVDNLTALAKAGAPVAAWLARHDPDPETIFGRIVKNRHGTLDWRMDNGQGIFEALPPALHYRDWRPREGVEGGATVIVGTALGYGLNHVLTGVPPSHRIVVLEPRPELLMACLSQTDYRPFIANGQLTFLPPERQLLEKTLQGLDVSFLFARINVRNDMPSTQLGPEYAQCAGLVRAILENMSVDLTTLRLKQEVMVGNELRNFSRAMHDGSLSRMAGAATGLTAVLLGAGPSLPRLAPAVARHRDKALFATALQTLPALERLGIKPHMCLAIDFNTDMGKCIENLRDPAFAADVPLIYSTKMQPEVVERYPGPTLPLWTEGGMATYVLKDLELVLDAGGNVGVTLERFLTWAGARRFVLVGQDLAWREEATHAAGHHAASSGTSDIRLKSRDGETLFTHMGFVAAKRDLEKDFAAPDVRAYNLYGGGAVIAGAPEIDPDTLDDPAFFAGQGAALRVFLDALARAATPRTRPVFSQKAGVWANSLKNASKRLEKLMRKADKHQGELKHLLSQIQLFLRHDPLYMPYLYNEIMELAGMIHTRPRIGVKEMTQFQALRKRVLAKIREIDVLLGPTDSFAA